MSLQDVSVSATRVRCDRSRLLTLFAEDRLWMRCGDLGVALVTRVGEPAPGVLPVVATFILPRAMIVGTTLSVVLEDHDEQPLCEKVTALTPCHMLARDQLTLTFRVAVDDTASGMGTLLGIGDPVHIGGRGYIVADVKADEAGERYRLLRAGAGSGQTSLVLPHPDRPTSEGASFTDTHQDPDLIGSAD